MITTNLEREMKVNTSRFGEISVEEPLIITLPDGMIGFEDCKRFVVLHQDPKNPLKWFQSLDDGAVAFPIINPWDFKKDYSLSISDADADFLHMDEDTPKIVFVVVTVPRNNPAAMTANLLGPIVINPLRKIGKQVVLSDERYTTRHSIMEEIHMRSNR